MSQPEPIVTRDVRARVWVLVEDYLIELRWGRLRVAAGFRFDLASVPRFFWRLVAPFELSLAAPLAHDFLYRTKGRFNGHQLTRVQCDQEFLRIMMEQGVDWRRKPAYLAVRLFGWFPWIFGRR